MNRPSVLMTSARYSKRVITSRPVSWLRVYFAIILIASAFVWSVYRIVTTRVQESPPGTITIRMVHWQLEAGVREAIAKMAEKYQQLHPNVRVVQEAVPEPVYATWLTTNLLGGTAPDLVEVPFGHMPEEIVRQFHNRYFVPLTPFIGRPNPYNKGTELEGKPLRATFKDGMRLAYVKEIQEYMVMPVSLFGTRMFYNKDLLRKLTGLDKPPLEYRAFIQACEKIASQSDAEGNRYSPIASSKDHFWAWDGMMFNPLTYPLLRKIDFDRDGKVSADEAFAGFKCGRVDFNSPPYKARYKMMREVCNFCQPGYTGVALQDAVFLFAQQRAVFLATGTWDARSMQDQVGSEFEMAISEFPVPAPDDPDYGQYFEGPVYEEPERGFPFSITRQSEHQDEALDFLFFLASQKYNEEMNQIMGWMPVIHGAKMDAFLKPFEPHLEGVYSCLMPSAGSETRNKYQQVYSLYQANQISYEQFVAQFEPFYKERGLEDFNETKRDWQRATHEDEQRLASLRFDAMRATPDSAEAKWRRYRVVMQTRQLLPELEHYQKFQLIESGPEAGAPGPYEYSAAALKIVKERVRNGK